MEVKIGRKKRGGQIGNKGNTKPRSGLDNEIRKLVIKKCWDRVNKKLESKVYKLKKESKEEHEIRKESLEKEKGVIALEIVKRSVPQDLNIGGELKTGSGVEQKQLDQISNVLKANQLI